LGLPNKDKFEDEKPVSTSTINPKPITNTIADVAQIIVKKPTAQVIAEQTKVSEKTIQRVKKFTYKHHG
jgi:uncharacterized protein YerC